MIRDVACNVDFDPTTRTMTSFLKDNSMTACGLWHKRRLSDESHLMPLETRDWYECDDIDEGPESLPLELPLEEQK